MSYGLTPTGPRNPPAGLCLLSCSQTQVGAPPLLSSDREMKEKDRYWDCLDQAMEASHGGRNEESLAWLDEAQRAQPEGAEAHNGRGEILWD